MPPLADDMLEDCCYSLLREAQMAAILKDGQSAGGLLKEGSRRKLSQLIIHHTFEKRLSGKITTPSATDDDNDAANFNQTYPGKENNLFSMLNAKQEDILAYAKGKAEHSRNNTLRTEILNLIGMIRDDDTETEKKKYVCLMLLAYVINVSPARKRNKGAAALKLSRAEICDGFIKQVSSEAHVTIHIIEK